MAPFRKNRRHNRRWRRRPRVLGKKKKFAVAKSLGYKGFHCFKETTNGTINMGPISQTEPYNFKLNDIKVNNLSLSPTAAAAWRFNINQVTQWTYYRALFQQFRITGVKIKFFPAITNTMDADISASDIQDRLFQGENVPSLIYKMDPNDNINWTAWSECMQCDPKVKTTKHMTSIYFKPKLRTADYQTSNVQNDSVNTKTAKWCNFDKVVGQTDAPVQAPAYTYSGLDMGSYNNTSRMNLNFLITYYFQCKTPQ